MGVDWFSPPYTRCVSLTRKRPKPRNKASTHAPERAAETAWQLDPDPPATALPTGHNGGALDHRPALGRNRLGEAVAAPSDAVPAAAEGLMDKLGRLAREAAGAMAEVVRDAKTGGGNDENSSYNDRTRPWFRISKRPTYRILAIDGGGIRGLVPARVLEEIERRTGKPIAQQFDLITGTSTGAVLGLGLSVPDRDRPTQPRYRAADLAQMYAEGGETIFPPSRFRKLKQVVGPAYDPAPLHQALEDYFGDTKMSDALTSVIVPSYDIEKGDPLNLRHIKGQDQTRPDYFMRDVVAASSAAPTFFPPHTFASVDGTQRHVGIDGGVIARNPSLFALTQALKLAPKDAKIELISLGTGAYPPKIPFQTAKGWGALDWANPANGSPMVGVMMDGASEMANKLAGRLLGDGFVRIDMDIDQMPKTRERPSGALDDASPQNIERLERFARRLIADNSDRIDDICRRIDPGYRPPSRSASTAEPTQPSPEHRLQP